MTTKTAVMLCITSYFTCFVVEASAYERLEEVIVTAQKRNESLSDVPIAIDVVAGEFIESANVIGLSQLEYAIPSVNFGAGGRKTRGEIAIRGVGDYSRNIGTEARVAVYVDEVPLGRSSAFDASLADIDQIEVLKGPQGTLFGINTIAGAINIRTMDPSDELEGSVTASVGSRNHTMLGLKSNVVFSEQFSGRIQYSRYEEDGFVNNITTGKTLQGSDLESGRLKLLYQPNERFKLLASADWLEDYSLATNASALVDDGNYNGFSAAPAPREVAHDAKEFERRKLLGGSIKMEYGLNSNAQITSITAYRSSQFEEFNEEDYGPLPAAFSLFDEDYQQLSQEFRYLSALGDSTDFVIGSFFALQETSTQRSASLFNADINNYVRVFTPGKLDSSTYSLFANVNYHISERYTISAGTRVQREEKALEYEITDNSTLFTNGRLDDKKPFTPFLPKVSFSGHLSEESLAYASISRGAKSGGWNADFVQSLDNIEFDPEFATSYELGYKGTYFNNLVAINTAAFVTKFDDFQVFQFVDLGKTTEIRLTNAGEVTSKGIELSLDLQLNRYSSVSINSAYTKAKFDVFENGGNNIDYSGNTLPYAPEFTAYTAFDFSYPLSASSELYFYMDYSYSDGYFSNPANANNQKIDSFHTVNGQVGFHYKKHCRVSMWGKNITDELYLRSRDVSFLGIQRGVYEAPRTVGVSLTYSI